VTSSSLEKGQSDVRFLSHFVGGYGIYLKVAAT